MFNLEGLKALVTGAGGGIGRAIAIRLAAAGAKVAAADIKDAGVKETARLIKEQGGEAFPLVADVAKDAPKLVADAVEALGGLDILVNNAGTSSMAFIEGVTDAELARVFEVNLNAVFRLVRAASPHLKKSGRGRIINMSSVEGIRGSGALPVYSATKAGLIGLTRSNAIELGRFGVTVNAICPGPIQTEMLAPLIADPKYKERFIKGIAMKRLGVPEDVAGAAAFLASPEASFITGNIIVIDGGMTIKSL